MDEKEYYVIIDKKLDGIKETIDLLFKKHDAINEKIIRHDEKINLLWAFTLTALTTSIASLVNLMITVIIKKGG